MRPNRWWRVGPVLLIVGGLLETVAYGLASVSSSTNVFLGGIFPGVDVVALGSIGVGLIATGISVAGRGRTALKVAGVLALALGIVEVVHTGIPIGPLPGFSSYLAYIAGVGVAGGRLLSDRTLGTGVRWSVAIPAICLLFSVSGDYVPLFAPVLSLPGMTLLPWAGMVVAGILLLRDEQRRRRAVTAHPLGPDEHGAGGRRNAGSVVR